jgi:hypothetical protein
MTPTTPYRFCSRAEVEERQKLGQVSELEATLETCRLPQSQRRLDPSLAVAKYRRSAAGSDPIEPRSVVTLQVTLDHLTNVCATFQATSKHPRIDNVHVVFNFVTDRLRACQSDATRKMGAMDHESLPASWHAQVIRLLIWLDVSFKHVTASTDQNTTTNHDSLLPRTIRTMRSTAYDAYWCVREAETSRTSGTELSHDNQYRLDDEMLCYDAIFRIYDQSNQRQQQSLDSWSLQTSWSGMLLEYTKRRQTIMSSPQYPYTYPLWHQALQIATRLSRHEYYSLLPVKDNALPILARYILTSVLFRWQYQTVQRYNVSFANGEVVGDMDRLLSIEKDHWCLDYANTFGGVPVSVSSVNDGDCQSSTTLITMTMKQVAMPTLGEGERKTDDTVALAPCIEKHQQQWAFGEHFQTLELFGLTAQATRLLIQTGSIVAAAAVVEMKSRRENHSTKTTTSLGKALLNVTPNLSNTNAKPAKNVRKKQLQPVHCKFFSQGHCRYGDQCRFVHSYQLNQK